MKIKQLFNTTEGKIESREHNIFIPICLGNKFFSHKGVLNNNIKEYLNWALEYTKEKVLLLVVDKIQDTNFFIRNKTYSEAASLRRVLKDGNIIKQNIEEFISTFPLEIKERVNVINWDEYEKEDIFWPKTTQSVYREFKNNKDFRTPILKAVKESLLDRKFKEYEYWKLCDYVLDEFSLAYSGINYKGVYYNLSPYPRTDSVFYFICDIVLGKTFERLNKKLPDRKNAWAIIN
ncbi:MAG: hypothetical protein PF542_04630 [Nanoarchaeota archaeon]|jgi:tRNA-dependent cyclodipeptide synthase|nr:hypothetical protein [Nanoarchaeota archaeon]